MKLSRAFTFVTHPVLFLLEYTFKFITGVVSLIVLGSQGSFYVKLGTGFGSLLNVLSGIMEWPGKLIYLGNVIRDYNTLTASNFNQRYGGEAMNRVMESLNESVAYFQSVYQNLINQPVATVLATLLAFIVFYFFARSFRFVRQGGEGSYLVRKERNLGKRIFHDSEV